MNKNFTSTDYTLTIQPRGKNASTIYAAFNGDMGTDKAIMTLTVLYFNVGTQLLNR